MDKQNTYGKIKKKGFTLAEILITLTVIGVVAAITVPIIIQKKEEQVFRTGYKKAYAAITQAVAMEYSQENLTFSDYHPEDVFEEFINKMHYSEKNNVWYEKTGEGVPSSCRLSITGSNGIQYCMEYPVECDYWNQTPCAVIWIDVNGDKKPNTRTTDIKKLKDIYRILLYSQMVKPGDEVAQQMMSD